MRYLSSLFYDDASTNPQWAPHSTAALEDNDVRAKYIDALDRLRKLKDDWNGYGALAPDAAALDTAAKFIAIYPMAKTLPDRIHCGTDRSVVLEWQPMAGTARIVLTVDPYNVGAVKVSNTGGIQDIGEFSIYDNTSYLPLKLSSELPSKAA